MALDLGRLLAPVSDDNPVGPDLAYDPGRYEIEQAFETEVSIDASGVAGKADDIDWRQVINRIAEQGEKTKDIWLAVYLCRAGAVSAQLEAVEIGAQYLAGLLEDYWPAVHPQLEEYGFQGRKGPCESLTGHSQFINPLRRMKLLRHPRLGEYSGEDFERFRANGESEDGYGMFRAALDDVSQDGLDAIARHIDAIVDGLRRADLVLTANADGSGGVNFQPTYDALGQMKRAVLAFGSKPAEADEPMAEQAAPGDADRPAHAGPAPSGRIESREDVIRALDAVSDYYRRKEPSHPTVTILQRAREWVGLDFIAILEDIAPGSISEVRTVLQSRKQRDDL